MTVEWFRTLSFKGLKDQEVSLHPRLTVFVGDNGAGKSSALEALHIVCRGRSLGASPADRVRTGDTGWRVEARLRLGESPSDRLAVVWNGRTSAVFNDRRLAFSRYYRLQPVALFDWSSHQLANAGPKVRRGFLDWQLFHVEQDYAEVWFQWRRLLAQRNKAIQASARDQAVKAWDQALALAAIKIDAARRRAVAAVQPDLEHALRRLFDFAPLGLSYQPGWEGDYLSVLADGLAQDRRRGKTLQGPQRGDWRLTLGPRSLGDLSRGEQKLALTALLMTSASAIGRAVDRVPLMLIDDFAAELSDRSQASLRHMIAGYGGQIALAVHHYHAENSWTDHQMFHVERGVIAGAIQ